VRLGCGRCPHQQRRIQHLKLQGRTDTDIQNLESIVTSGVMPCLDGTRYAIAIAHSQQETNNLCIFEDWRLLGCYAVWLL
jgi:hypothetical protein